jgi:integrase
MGNGWVPRLVGGEYFNRRQIDEQLKSDGTRPLAAPIDALDPLALRILEAIAAHLPAGGDTHLHFHLASENPPDSGGFRHFPHARATAGVLHSVKPTGVVAPDGDRRGRAGTDALPFPGVARSPIAEAIDAACADMKRRGSKDSSVARFRRLWTDCVGFNGWDEPKQCSYAGAAAWLAHKRECGWSGPTHDQGVSALRVLGRFLHRAGYVPQNPFEFVEASGESGGAGSRALTTDEVRAMLRAAADRQQRDGRAGKGNRALFWAFLALTGLRGSEAEACRWRDIDLDGAPPAIYSDPKWAKNGRRMRVVLNPEIRELLTDHRRSVPCRPDDLVFPITPNRASWRAMRELAGVAAEDGRGREATAHGLRKWLATTLDATGASPGVVSRILRHSDNLAQERYIDPDPRAEVEAVGRLPRLWPPPRKLGSEKSEATIPSL